MKELVQDGSQEEGGQDFNPGRWVPETYAFSYYPAPVPTEPLRVFPHTALVAPLRPVLRGKRCRTGPESGRPWPLAVAVLTFRENKNGDVVITVIIMQRPNSLSFASVLRIIQ